jgi:hypothetical protein
MEQLGPRPFSFYPAIVNIDHNEWIYAKATWSEILVINAKTKSEIWVPRRFLGDVSSIEDPVVIVGLLKELEYRAGGLWPVERRVIEMPRAVNDIPRFAHPPEASQAPRPVVGIRLASRTENRVGRLILASVAIGIAGCVLLVSLYRGEVIGAHVAYSPVLQSNLDFTNQDDYYSVVRKLGTPDTDHWRSSKGELEYRSLTYRRLGYSVILMGEDRKSGHYIGAMGRDWRPIHSVSLATRVNSYDVLRSLPKF